jgi:hypothetical protein
VALATEVGVPESNPVEVLKVSPAGAAGEMEYEAIAPPVDVIVYPVIALLTVFVSALDEIVNAGAARTALTVSVNVRVALPEAFVAVIV